MPKPETIAWLRHAATAGDATSQALLEVLERLERLEAARPAPAPTDEADAPQTLHTIALRMVDSLELDANVLPEICDTLRRAIWEPAPCPHIRSSDEGTSYCALAEQISESENDRRFHACMKAIDEATPEQIRAATGAPQPPAGLSLIDEIADAFCGRYYDPAGVALWRPEARRAAAVIVRRLRERNLIGCSGAANWLEQEAKR